MREDNVQCCKPEFWAYLLICLVLVSFAGITSGLALGLLSFSQVDLEVLVRAGQPQDRKNAAKILPLVKNEHLLLCTLLICKSLAMEALPIFLDSILPTWGAIIMSVTLVLAFAEIIPQAVCSRYGLSLGAKSSALVRLLLLIFFPISFPISKHITGLVGAVEYWRTIRNGIYISNLPTYYTPKSSSKRPYSWPVELLDWLLGKGHSVLLRRAELKTLVDLHANEAGKGGDLSHHETTIITGALDLTQKTAKDAMTPISEIFSLDINSKLDMHTMGLMISQGHSRIPIYSGNPKNIIGLILVKNLIFCRPEDETPIKYLTIRRIPRVHENWPLYDILNQFQKGHSHMAVVVKCKKDVNNTANNVVGKPSTLDKNTDSISKPTQAERKGSNSPCDQKEHMSISTYSSPLYSTDTEFQSQMLKNVMEQDNDLHPQYKKREQGDGIFSYEDLESPPNNLDEEVIGIITMEDVLEELLQEEILDETDEYVDVHNKIRINLLPLRRSSPRSPRRVSVSRLHWRTPEPSPLSSYTSILHSPLSPYIPPPLMRPTLYDSPGKAMLNQNHPAGSAGPVCSSPSSHRVSRKSYERLQR